MTSSDARYCPVCFRSFTEETERCPEHNSRLITLPIQHSLLNSEVDGKYEILELLGQGGMGTVYRARQKFIEREVALKVLRGEFARDVTGVKRFFSEARAASKLRNRHSVVLFDFGLAKEGFLYFTMELLRGVSLGRVLKDRGPLSAGEAVHIAIDVCHSLEEAHSMGIVHRDLKPDNIIIVEDRDEYIAKVVDFGIAKLLTDDDGTSLTNTGMLCGTPAYMSPEQSAGREVGRGSDIYSLGIVLYEMLAGFPPFRAETPVLLLMKHINEEPRRISSVHPEVNIPASLDELLVKMLSKKPSERPNRVRELRESLEEMLQTASSEAQTVRLRALAEHSTGLRRIVTDDYDGKVGPNDETHSASAMPSVGEVVTATAEADKTGLSGSLEPEPDPPRRARLPRLLAGAALLSVGIGLLLVLLPGVLDKQAGKAPEPAGMGPDASAALADGGYRGDGPGGGDATTVAASGRALTDIRRARETSFHEIDGSRRQPKEAADVAAAPETKEEVASIAASHGGRDAMIETISGPDVRPEPEVVSPVGRNTPEPGGKSGSAAGDGEDDRTTVVDPPPGADEAAKERRRARKLARRVDTLLDESRKALAAKEFDKAMAKLKEAGKLAPDSQEIETLREKCKKESEKVHFTPEDLGI